MLVAGLRTKHRLPQDDLFSRLRTALLEHNTEEKFDLICWLVSSKPLRIADDFKCWLEVPKLAAVLKPIELNNTFIGRYCLLKGCRFSKLPDIMQLELSFEDYELLADCETLEAHTLWGMSDVMLDPEIEAGLRALDRAGVPGGAPVLEEEAQPLGKRSQAALDSAPPSDQEASGAPVKKREIEVQTAIDISDSSSNCKPLRVVESIAISDSGNKAEPRDVIEILNSDCEVTAEPLRSPEKPVSCDRPPRGTPIVEESLNEDPPAPPRLQAPDPLDQDLFEGPFRITATGFDCEAPLDAAQAPIHPQEKEPAGADSGSDQLQAQVRADSDLPLLTLPQEAQEAVKTFEAFEVLNPEPRAHRPEEAIAASADATEPFVSKKIDEEPIPEDPIRPVLQIEEEPVLLEAPVSQESAKEPLPQEPMSHEQMPQEPMVYHEQMPQEPMPHDHLLQDQAPQEPAPPKPALQHPTPQEQSPKQELMPQDPTLQDRLPQEPVAPHQPENPEAPASLSPCREEVRAKSNSPIDCQRESPLLMEAIIESAQRQERIPEDNQQTATAEQQSEERETGKRDFEVSLIPSPTPEARNCSNQFTMIPPNTPIINESLDFQLALVGSKIDLEVPAVQPEPTAAQSAEEQESNLPQTSEGGNPGEPLLPSTSSPKEPTVIVDELTTAADRKPQCPCANERDSPKKRLSPELQKEQDSNVAVHDSTVNDIEDDRLEITLPESMVAENEADTPNPSRATAVFQACFEDLEASRLGKPADGEPDSRSDGLPDPAPPLEPANAQDPSATDCKENLSIVPAQDSLTPSLVTNEKLIERFCNDPQIILKHFNIDAQKLHLLHEQKVVKSSSQSVPRSAPVTQDQKSFSKLLREKSPIIEKVANSFLNPLAFRKSVQKEPKPLLPTGSIEVEEVVWDQRSDKTFPGNHTPKTNDIFNFLMQRSEKNAFTMGSQAATLGMPETNDPFRISVEAAVKENDLRCLDVEVIRDSPIKKAISEKKREVGNAFRVSPASLADRNVALSETNMLQNYVRTKSPILNLHGQGPYSDQKPFVALQKASRKTANKPIVVESPQVPKVSVGVQVNTYAEDPQLSDLIRNQTLIQKELATIKTSIARGHYMGEAPLQSGPGPAKGLNLEERLIMRDLLDRETGTSQVAKAALRLQRDRENQWMRENKEEVREILLGLQADYKARASKHKSYYYYSQTDSDSDETSSSGLNPSIMDEESIAENPEHCSFLKKPAFHISN